MGRCPDCREWSANITAVTPAACNDDIVVNEDFITLLLRQEKGKKALAAGLMNVRQIPCSQAPRIAALLGSFFKGQKSMKKRKAPPPKAMGPKPSRRFRALVRGHRLRLAPRSLQSCRLPSPRRFQLNIAQPPQRGCFRGQRHWRPAVGHPLHGELVNKLPEIANKGFGQKPQTDQQRIRKQAFELNTKGSTASNNLAPKLAKNAAVTEGAVQEAPEKTVARSAAARVRTASCGSPESHIKLRNRAISMIGASRIVTDRSGPGKTTKRRQEGPEHLKKRRRQDRHKNPFEIQDLRERLKGLYRK